MSFVSRSTYWLSIQPSGWVRAVVSQHGVRSGICFLRMSGISGQYHRADYLKLSGSSPSFSLICDSI